MQRDVEVEFDSTDKSGGFIGTMYVNKENVALELVKEGLAAIHAYSADALPWVKSLYEVEVRSELIHIIEPTRLSLCRPKPKQLSEMYVILFMPGL